MQGREKNVGKSVKSQMLQVTVRAFKHCPVSKYGAGSHWKEPFQHRHRQWESFGSCSNCRSYPVGHQCRNLCGLHPPKQTWWQQCNASILQAALAASRESALAILVRCSWEKCWFECASWNWVCCKQREKLLKFMLEKFCNWQQLKKDEYEDSFLTSLSNYLQKKGHPRQGIRQE